ncbi:hypothetical protein BJX96DRAFT_163384 [Aspergillus floccosus]
MDVWPTLEDALPESERGRILITTRNRKLAVELASSDTIPIPDVIQETALKILEKSLVDQTLLRDRETAVTLLTPLTFLPLAITQASAYINKNCLNMSTYLEPLQEKEPDIVDLLSEDFRDAGRYRDIQNPVITTLLISFEQIQRQNQLAADYLSFIACIDSRNIPYSLVPPSISKKRKVDALGLLSSYSFINAQDTNISLHRLVHIAIRNWLKKSSVFSHWIQRVANRMAEVFPNGHYTDRVLSRHDGRYHDAELLYTDLMRLRTEKNGHENHNSLTTMEKLAKMNWNQGRWTEAEELQIQVLKKMKTVRGAEHPDTLTTMVNLSFTWESLGKGLTTRLLYSLPMLSVSGRRSTIQYQN